MQQKGATDRTLQHLARAGALPPAPQPRRKAV
jgi:hypothetical protein